MNRKEINLSDMMQSVDEFLTNNASLIQTQTPLVQAHTRLHAINSDIFLLNQQQAIDTKGDTVIKGNQKKELVQHLTKVAAATGAHAAAIADPKLKLTATVSDWELQNMRENDLVVKAKTIYDAALPVVSSLATWGVTQADLDTLNADFTGFKQKTPAIRNIQVSSTQATANLKVKLKEGKTLLKETIDAMMLPYKNLNPVFYGQYLDARSIVERAAGHATKEAASKDTATSTAK